MNRPAFALIALAGLLAAFGLPAHSAIASNAYAMRAQATPTPSPTPSDTSSPGDGSTPAPAPAGSAAPSPTVVVPLVDISVSNPSPSPSPSPVPSDGTSPAASPSPSATPRKRNGRATPVPTATPTPTDAPTDTPTAQPTATSRRGSVAPRRSASPSPSPSPSAEPTIAPVSAPQTPAEDITSTSIPTQPPTPRPVAPLQPSIPDSLDDPNVESILSRPPGQLAPFNWMSGTWNAHTTEYHGDNKGRDLGQNTYVFATTMKGRWMFGGDGKATDYFYITYDPFARQWAIVRFNGNPSYGIWLSRAGFRQNRIVFDSTYAWANGRQYRRRLTISRNGQKHFNIFDEEELPNGAWLADQSIDFTKQ